MNKSPDNNRESESHETVTATAAGSQEPVESPLRDRIHGPEGAPDQIPAGDLPTPFVVTLFAAILGALLPGVFMTLAASVRGGGSPLYGLLLPWTAVPFLLAVASAWKCRRAPACRVVAIWTVIAALLGAALYGYGFLFHKGDLPAARMFLWIPLWQCLLLTRATLRGFRS